MKAPLVVVSVLLVSLVSCNRDPNVAKKKYLDLGNTYFSREQYKQAAIMYRNALQRDQKFGMAYYKLGLTHLKLSNPGAAVAALRRAVAELPPNSPEKIDANIKLADIYLLAGTKDKRLVEEVAVVAQDLVKKDAKSFD